MTVSGVGAPAATEFDVRVADYLASVEMVTGRGNVQIAGFISSESGGFSSANGFVQSALTGFPVVDAPCNGRAHPTGVMGSMGLHQQAYVSKQAAAGGTPGLRRVSLYAEGDLKAVDHVVREAAVAAGGMVAVTRNPVSASYVRDHGAPGALQQALELGEALLTKAERGGQASAEAVLTYFGVGDLMIQGLVQEHRLITRGGYDIGQLVVEGVRVTFWNEYMTVERAGKRVASFPDLIFTLDRNTGLPLTSAELEAGREVILAVVPQDRLLLGAGVRDIELLRQIDQVLELHSAGL